MSDLGLSRVLRADCVQLCADVLDIIFQLLYFISRVESRYLL